MNEIDAGRWAHLSPLVDTALELDDEARAAWLAALAMTDPESARDLAELLARDRARTGTGTGTVTRVLRELNGEAPDLTGTTIGSWTLTSPLGSGGMGTVWLADRSDGNYQGTAAVKLLNVRDLGATGLQRFQQEGTALARLTHPNIARLLNAGVREMGQPYLVLEHVEGVRIDAWCDANRLTISERLELFRQVCAAVEHAHGHLVIHRDLKPSNVLVTAGGTVKLLDFGVARLMQEESRAGAQVALPFTPAYAAPEQLSGETESAATDIYSLGVLLHVLLAGQVPARPAGRVSDMALAMSAAQATARRSTPEAIASALRGDLDATLRHALSPAPAERYQSVTAFADDLRRLLAHESVSVRAAGLGERARKFVRRHRVPVGAAGAVAAALIAGTVISVQQMREARVQRDRAEFAAEVSQAAGDMQLQMLSLIGPGGRQLTPTEVLSRGRAIIESRYRDRPAMLSSLLSNLADRYADLNDLGNQRALMYSAALAARRANEPAREAAALCLTGWVSLQQGHADSAAALIREGMALMTKARFDTAQMLIACNTARALQFAQQQQQDSAVALTTQSIGLLERNGDTLSSNYATALNNLGSSQGIAGRPREGEKALARSAHVLQQIGRGETEGMAVVQGNRLASLIGLGQFLDARALLESERQRILGGDASGVLPLVLRFRAVQLYSRLHQVDSLERYARTLFADSQAQNPMVQVEARALLSVALLSTQRAADARRVYAELRAMLPGAPPLPRLRTTVAVADAAFRAADGNPKLALDSLRAFLQRSSTVPGGNDTFLYPALLRASELAVAAGDGTVAVTLARQAVAAASVDSEAVTRSALTGDALAVEARALALMRDTVRSRTTVARAISAMSAGYGARHPRVEMVRRWVTDSL